MQVEGDVRAYSYIRQSPTSGWSTGEADSPPSDARIWEDVDEHKVGEADVDRQCTPVEIFGYRVTCPTTSEMVTRKVEENSLAAHCSLEASEEKCSRTRNLDGSGQIEPWRVPSSKSPQGASEQETEGAQLQSQKIATQPTSPPGPSSKGVLLFNRRKQRVDELTLGSPRAGRPLDGDGQPKARVVDEEAAVPYFEQRDSMEEEEELKEVAAKAEAAVQMENRQSETGPEAPVAPVRPPPAQVYLEMPVEARRDAEASSFARPPLPNPPLTLGRTGILEQSRIRKPGWKPMFTFHERPRLAPNPELLSLVHGTDVQRKAEGGGRGEVGGDEGLGLGAEACTLAQAKGPAAAPAPSPAVTAGEERPSPEWASCLKPPELRPHRRPIITPHGLAEVRGKGAELFARRQTRMERFTLEAPTPPPRPPSPTASLPAGWKCSTKPEASACVIKAAPPLGHRHLSSATFVISPPPIATGAKLNSKPSPPPPTAAKPQRPRLNGFTTSENRRQVFQPVHASSPDRATLPPAAPRSSEATQAPRPTFSARRAGLEAQGWTSPVTPPWKATLIRSSSIPRTYLETIQPDRASDTTPQSPQTPSYSPSPNSCTPPTEQAPGSSEGQRLKDLLAKNVVSAARRKKLSRSATSPGSPSEILSPFSPRSDCFSPLTTPPSPSSPSPVTHVRSPLRLYRRSLTDSEFSLGSDGSGPRSPSYHNFCPRGWTGSRVRQSEQ
ncbi:synaptopodin isoform X2 [Hypanus sabinus]|uniref:synaptopodin isoform X2 n=1 Tax=Hypanus sabinus TaxID=79690 RepID=UPI0028C42225|nr:synaptopodin isoform X2 [Hypanus sabinus]